MGIKLIKRKAEASATPAEFQKILDSLALLYSGNVQFKYDGDQNAVIVTKGSRTVGTVPSEGALHTVIWSTMGLVEKEA